MSAQPHKPAPADATALSLSLVAAKLESMDQRQQADTAKVDPIFRRANPALQGRDRGDLLVVNLMNPLIFFWILSDHTSTVLSKIIGWGLNHHGNNGPHIGMVWRYLHVLEQRI